MIQWYYDGNLVIKYLSPRMDDMCGEIRDVEHQAAESSSVWSDLIWSDLIWPDLNWSDLIWPDLHWSSHFSTRNRLVTILRVASRSYVVFCLVMSCHFSSCHVMSCHVMLWSWHVIVVVLLHVVLPTPLLTHCECSSDHGERYLITKLPS
jgi:hypothetical protein